MLNLKVLQKQIKGKRLFQDVLAKFCFGSEPGHFILKEKFIFVLCYLTFHT